MFWKTSEPHGLPHSPYKSCIIPRPIGWISTLAADGTPNLAPYSFFNGVSEDPPMVMFASVGSGVGTEVKDSIANAEATGSFVCVMVGQAMLDAMNASAASVAPDVNEFDLAGLEMEPAEMVTAPRVKGAPIHLECTYHDTIRLPDGKGGRPNRVCIGNVVGVHIDDAVMNDGIIDVSAFRPVARLGYKDYTTVDNVFTLLRPGQKG